MNRFLSLGLVVFSLLLTACASSKKSTVEEHYRIPMLQVLTGENFAQFNVLTPVASKFYVAEPEPKYWTYKINVLDDEKNLISNVEFDISHTKHPGSLWKVSRLYIKGLEAEKDYYLQFIDEDNNEMDLRSFKTLNLGKRNANFVVSSCMADFDRYLQRQKRVWRGLSDRFDDLDFVVLNGDNVYADSFAFFGRGKEASKSFHIWQRYVDSFRRIELFRLPKLIPTLSTWDDHDFAKNNSGTRWKYKGEAKRVFKAFFGSNQVEDLFEYKEGVSSKLSMFGHQFIFLDNRTFRKKEGSISKYAHWGRKQEKWMLGELSNPDAKPALIFNGGQFFGGYSSKESLESDHKKNFQSWTKSVKKATKVPFVLFSGDLHFTETMKIEKEVFGFETYEITASAWHSRPKNPFKKKYSNNPRRIKDFTTKGFNYVMVNSSVDDEGVMELRVSNVVEGKEGVNWSFGAEVKR